MRTDASCFFRLRFFDEARDASVIVELHDSERAGVFAVDRDSRRSLRPHPTRCASASCLESPCGRVGRPTEIRDVARSPADAMYRRILANRVGCTLIPIRARHPSSVERPAIRHNRR